MLHYLRHIRQKLILQENIRKYLLYAVGEIILVVIGILIALQVNNWNQNRINHIKEEQLRAKLNQALILAHKDAQSTARQIEENIQILEFIVNNWQDLELSMIQNKLSEFQNTFFTPFFSIISYSTFYDLDGDVYRTAVNDGSIALIQNEEYIYRNDRVYNYYVTRVNEFMNEEYQLSQDINDHIAVNYSHIFVDTPLKTSTIKNINGWSEEAYNRFLIEIRTDGTLRYKFAQRIELKKARLYLTNISIEIIKETIEMSDL